MLIPLSTRNDTYPLKGKRADSCKHDWLASLVWTVALASSRDLHAHRTMIMEALKVSCTHINGEERKYGDCSKRSYTEKRRKNKERWRGEVRYAEARGTPGTRCLHSADCLATPRQQLGEISVGVHADGDNSIYLSPTPYSDMALALLVLL